MKSKQKKVKKPIKISSTKLANKQHNKLAKQGKLKAKNRKNAKRQKYTEKPIVSPLDREFEDDDLSDEDIKFYSSSFNRSFAKSVVSEEPEKKSRKKKHVGDDGGVEYESTPRVAFNGDKGEKRMKMMLPIKSHDKLIPQMMEEVEEAGGDEVPSEPTEEQTALSELQPDSVTPMSNLDLLRLRSHKMAERKRSISKIANLILSDPQEHVGKLKDLRAFLHEPDADVFITVKKLAMVTLMEVFKDILPDYKVRLLGKEEGQTVFKDILLRYKVRLLNMEEEGQTRLEHDILYIIMEVFKHILPDYKIWLLNKEEEGRTMKKVTKALMDFEKSLVNNYRQYLEFLEKTSTGKIYSIREEKTGSITVCDDPDVIRTVSFLSVKCLCSLLITHHNFNYVNNIVAVLVPKMMEADDEVCDTVCEAIKQVFRQDKKGVLSLEIIKIMGDTLKRKNFNVQPKVLNTCLSLNIKQIDMSTAAERREEKRKKKLTADKMSRKDKRLNKRKAKLENELLETRASEDKEKTLKMHTDIIKNLFVSYFRILKNASHSLLMPAVLEGLARFAHLINVEFFDDLFSVFNKLIQSQSLQYRELLHCVQTAFTILTGQGSVLNVDPIQFYRHFYNNLFKVHAGKSSPDLTIVLGCLDIMLSQRKRQVSMQRVLAFLKRIVTMSLHQLPHGSLAVLAVARGFIRTYPRSELLFDSETQGSGVYMSQLEDPEYCNAQNTALWELPLLTRHYHKDIALVARHVSLQAPTSGQGQLPATLTIRKPVELFALHNETDRVFDDRIPEKAAKPKHGHRDKVSTDWIQTDLQEQCSRIAQSIPDLPPDIDIF